MIPDGWKFTALGDLLESIEAGWSPLCESHQADDDRWGVLKVSAVSSGTYLSTENKALPTEQMPKPELEVHEGDLLLARASGVLNLVGRAVIIKNTRSKLMLSDKILRLKPKPGVADAGFLNALLASKQVRTMLMNVTGGSHMRNISQGDLRALMVTCPPLTEQKKISSVCFSLDDVISTAQATIDQLGIVKSALMADLLNRGIPGRHNKFKQTEVGKTPDLWSVLPLSAVASVQTGIAKGKQVERGIELPYLRVANVQDGHVDLAEVKTMLVDRIALDRFSLKPGDVLFTEGGDADKLGRGCVWMGQIDPCLHQNHVFAVRTDRSRLLPAYLAHWAASPRGKRYFIDCAKQTTNLASVNSTQLKAFPIAIPPIREQEEIILAIDAVTSRILIERTYREHMVSVRDSLMSSLLTGEIRVTPDEQPA